MLLIAFAKNAGGTGPCKIIFFNCFSVEINICVASFSPPPILDCALV